MINCNQSGVKTTRSGSERHSLMSNASTSADELMRRVSEVVKALFSESSGRAMDSETSGTEAACYEQKLEFFWLSGAF